MKFCISNNIHPLFFPILKSFKTYIAMFKNSLDRDLASNIISFLPEEIFVDLPGLTFL